MPDLDDIQFCNLPASINGVTDGGLRQWSDGNLTFKIRPTELVPAGIPGQTDLDTSYDIVKSAFKAIGDRCGVRGVAIPAHSNRKPNILVGSRRIDGRHGVLAEAQLPWAGITKDQTLQLWFDNTDRFLQINNIGDALPVFEVTVHELLHNLGLGHYNGQRKSIMLPQITLLDPNEIAADDPIVQWLVDRYPQVDDGGGDQPGDGGDRPGSGIRDFIEFLINLCSTQPSELNTVLAQATIGDRLRGLLDLIRLFSNLDCRNLLGAWDQIQDIIECFSNLSPEDRELVLKLNQRFREGSTDQKKKALKALTKE
jgi:hypothetical protein